jgi:hypothetical protein
MSVPVSDRKTELVTLGSADIWINGIDVGHIKGDVTFACEREYVGFKPANELGNVKYFRIKEDFKITCQAAELRLTNLKTAMGVTTSLTSSFVPTGYDASLSFTVTPSTDKWDSLAFGGSKTLADFPLKLEHTRPNGNKFVILLYKAQCISNIDFAFKEEEISMQTLEFQGLTDTTRTVGDRIGIMFDQIS